MKKLILILAVTLSLATMGAGKFMAYFRLPDGTIKTLSFPSIPQPDKFDRYTFRVDDMTVVVHASNVWIISK